MKRMCAALALTIASASVAACARTTRAAEPVPVDRVECARCRMLISTEAGGAQIVSAQDDTRFYDDVRCLAADWATHHDGATAFVRLADGRWIDAAAAAFAEPPNARTAMGSGLAAFATVEEARAADRDRRASTWNDVLQRTGDGR